MIPTIVIVVIALAVVAWAVGLYNRLAGGRVRADEAWSDIDVQMKRRHDLIPQIVETVKGYAGHEKEALERVIQARSAAVGATGVAERAQAESFLGQALGKLFALAEAYPDLKANQNFLHLQEALVETEERIGSSRRFYNGNVRDYNLLTVTFPSNVIAGSFGFTKREFFELDDAEALAVRQPVAVKF